MKRKKVVFIQNTLMHYRVPLYRYLQEFYGDVTVYHSGSPSLDSNEKFNEIIVDTLKIKGFYFQKKLYKAIKEYDIIVGMFDLRWPLIWSLPFLLRRNQKFYLWGIGVSTEKGFDKDKKMDSFRFLIAKLANAIIFYSTYPLEKYKKAGFNHSRLFVANNTVFSEKCIDVSKRKFSNFIFIGSLTERKRIDILIDAFALIKKDLPPNIKLEIIGDGAEKEELRNYVVSKGIKDSVNFKGPIYDITEKNQVFQNAICTISPGQAGLSVLESFSYGVPFITSNDAITGGERFNVIEGETGFYVKDVSTLAKLMMDLAYNHDLVRKLSENCYEYYWENRQIKHMAKGFIEAFSMNNY